MTVRPTPRRTVPASGPELPTPRQGPESGVLPSYIEWLLARHARSVGRSRTLLRLQARSWGVPDETTETAVLLLSELMTNACRHARVPPGRLIGTRCVLLDRVLRIEVSDASDDLPQPRSASPDDESGRGLALVAALADVWGAHPRECGIGKTVWCELTITGG
ncbi:ATP-binding protein [Kitasatospora sp. MAP5-34]|uniref:ATP-binding protein n=1 Tax=Kitasatospora sp. MAP5-34 TaxID=3035102 RepID=UPI002475C515|nr:ATP-binding protein [Kitasatospora sp. MAP5-34]MDH6575730.1 anti-sigma regulatory factor (Ser/Thr protein kinase) [Kitasatospora sp. MAP5-34]